MEKLGHQLKIHLFSDPFQFRQLKSYTNVIEMYEKQVLPKSPVKGRSSTDRDTFYYLSKESFTECGGDSRNCQRDLTQSSGRLNDFNENVLRPSTDCNSNIRNNV